jgi:glyoxylase-like metal-dependent hydrolase (beta-lactamase superfamily II)
MIKKIFRILLIPFSIILVISLAVFLIYYPAIKFMMGNSQTTRIDDQLIVNSGAGCSTGIFTTDSIVLVIDTKLGKSATQQYEQVKKLAEGKKIIVVNTHADGDHNLGNKMYKEATIISSRYPENYWLTSNGSEGIPSVWVDDTMILKPGNETVSLINIGQAHTWNDLVVYFHNRKVLFTGDIVFNGCNPFLQKEKGSNVEGYIQALNRLLDLGEINTVVPGHGKPGGKEILLQMRNYFSDMLLASKNPQKEKEIIRKYRCLVTMPLVSSPAITIRYIRSKGK